MRRWFCYLLISFSMLNAAEEEDRSADIALLSRRDTLPDDIQTASDPYFEGYIQALIDCHYAEYCVVVIVKDHCVWLANMPTNKMIANSIASFVRDIPGVCEVTVLNGVPPQDEEIREKYVERPRINGIWFPQMTELYMPMIADPRNVTYAIGWRSGDRVIGKKTIGVSLGDDFPIYRWLDVFWCGDLQIGIEAGIWSVFNMDPKPNIANGWGELVNTDFYVGIPISMATGPWSFRLRGYHISSHLGDEFMIDHPEVVRVNPSIEAIDFFTSYQATEAIRIYVGPGVVVHSDPTFRWKPFYIEYGTEARFLGTKFHNQRLYGTMFLALFWRNEQELHFNFDGTYRAGYEFSKLQGIGRKFRLYVGYHHGYSLEGQFSKMRTRYFEFNMNYGF